ncbi:MAG: cytochrome P450 [Rhodospirillales bacterium]|nr:cytochrome P450 [Rhodospirillales bacterium]
MPLDIDPRAADFIADPYPALAAIRGVQPVFRSASLGGWVVTRHADCKALLKDPRLSADRMGPFFAHMPDERRARVARLEATVTRWAVFVDPPDHTRLRGLMNKAFSPRAIEGLGHLVARRVDALIDAFAGRRRIDFIRDFAYPLPATVIADLLGVPLADVDLLKRWSDDLGAFVLTARATPDKYERAEAAAREMETYFGDLVEARRAKPGDDAASWMIGAADRDARMSREELVATCVLLLFAGHETTTHLIGNGMWSLLTHPDEMAHLRANAGDSAFVEGAVEEMLRWDGPSLAQVRVARDRYEWQGVVFEPGDRIFLMLAAADRDPDMFADPDRFDLGRDPNPHLAFGFGIHFCVGAPLARLEARIAFPRLLERLPRIALAPQTLRWSDNLVVRGLHSLELDLDNG